MKVGPWSAEEDHLLRECIGEGMAALCTILGRDEWSIQGRIRKLRLTVPPAPQVRPLPPVPSPLERAAKPLRPPKPQPHRGDEGVEEFGLWTVEDDAELVQALCEGKSKREAAAALGRSELGVTMRLHVLGIKGRERSALLLSLAFHLLRQGRSPEEAAAQTGLDLEKVRCFVRDCPLLTHESQRRLERLAGAGLMISEIAREMGLPAQQVSRLVEVQGIKVRRNGRPQGYSEETKAQALALYMEGLTQRQVAERLGMRYSTVRHFLKLNKEAAKADL